MYVLCIYVLSDNTRVSQSSHHIMRERNTPVTDAHFRCVGGGEFICTVETKKG